MEKTYQAVYWNYGAIWVKVLIGEAYYLAGEYHKAEEKLEEAIDLAENCGVSFSLSFAYRIVVEVNRITESDASHSYFEKSI